MKHDKLFLVRILCLIGIAGELLIPNNIIRMLFGLFFAIISVDAQERYNFGRK